MTTHTRIPARALIWIPVLAALVVALDQWSKGLIRSTIDLYDTWAPFPALEPYFKLTHLTNSGAAFGILRGQSSVFVLIAIVVVVVVVIYMRHLPLTQWAVRACLGLQLGGALGNLTDRLRFNGEVTDFLLFSLPVGDRVFYWPAFNVADMGIVGGVLILAFLLLRDEGREDGDARERHEAIEPASSEQ